MAGGDIQLRDNGAVAGNIALAGDIVIDGSVATTSWVVPNATGLAQRLVAGTVVTTTWTVPDAVGDAALPHRLQEIASYVVFDATPDAKVSEVGLMVVHDVASPTGDAAVLEMGLMVVHDAASPATDAKLYEAGLMVVFQASRPKGRGGIQGEMLARLDMIQGNILQPRRGQL